MVLPAYPHQGEGAWGEGRIVWHTCRSYCWLGTPVTVCYVRGTGTSHHKTPPSPLENSTIIKQHLKTKEQAFQIDFLNGPRNPFKQVRPSGQVFQLLFGATYPKHSRKNSSTSTHQLMSPTDSANPTHSTTPELD